MFSNGSFSYSLEESSPLECPICKVEMTLPMIFGTCHHTLCNNCSIKGKSDAICPLCKTKNVDPPEEDEVMKYIIECSKDETDVCGNCDSIIAPMFFCETCSLPLCSLCRVSTHMAKIFSKHSIIPLEERGKIRGSLMCINHEQPYILYNLGTSQLLCIGCFNITPNDQRSQLVNIDVGHKICNEKLDTLTQDMKHLQEEIKEHIEMRKRILLELNENYKNSEAFINHEYDKVIQKIRDKKQNSLQDLQNEKQNKENKINEQLERLIHLQFPIRQNLLTSTIFCSYISKLDFLHMYDKLIRKLNETSHCDIEKLDFTSELTSVTNINFNTVLEDPAQHNQPPDPEMVFPMLQPSTAIFPNISDITTESDELLRKIEMPLKSFSLECSNISHELQEAQKDITQRRCLINDTTIDEMIERCKSLKSKINNHTSLIQSYQPILRQIWQLNLDNVRREQSIFRTKLDESLQLGDSIKTLTITAEKIKPFLDYLTSVVYTVNEKLVKPPDLAPMEKICLEICTIEPDSKTRCEAIEKEEEARRHAQEQKSCNEKIDFINATVKNLKHSKDGIKRKSRKKTKAFLSDHSCILASDDRDRNSFKVYTPKARTSTISSCESMTSLLDDSEIVGSLRLGCPSSHHTMSIQSISPTSTVLEEEALESIPPTPDHLKEMLESQGNNIIASQSRPSSQLGGTIIDPKIVKQKLLADIKEKVPLQPAVGENLNNS
ncbi:RING finger protein 207 [Strongyloides ratti]|uniref:RING finger protein 207 n=1 Tax=Strongyloides ratti TaxID=34506 RepID=A0A090KXB1_STRRB|nr:RING finger protein 207 [Strongyloides ratti]CEF62135.1 RING finger protein 207 [Strongyloides ratti]